MCARFLTIAGISVALWTLTHPWAELGRASVGTSRQWVMSHTFHFLAAIFGLAGFLGFVTREVHAAGTFERFGFAIAFMGTILFAGTGAFTAFLWPVLATHAPAITEVNGPFYSPPHPFTVATRFTYSTGHILFGVALMRSRVMGRAGGIALVTGSVLLMVPTEPISGLPWLIFPLGGMLFGTGLLALGRSVRGAYVPVQSP